MPVLRDIVARLGMDYDGRGFQQADQSINGLNKGLGTMAIAMAGVAAAMGSIKLIGLGSDAQETLNVLNTSFGDNSEAVQEWAADFAENSKRSEFAMREMASTMGAVLNPLMDRNKEAAAEMSTTLAALAVDLGSFFNATDEDAIRALKSGIIGQIEPLQKFGIVMTQANLSAFALEQGIKKDIKAMSIAEKTALRYQFILANTVDSQGDAAKTALGWANATKGLEGGLKDLGTNIGLVMLPMAERVLNWVSELTRGFSRLVKETNIVQAGLIVLGTIATALALKLLIAFAPIILKFILIGAAIAAAALIVEDFISFLQGKKSVIGEFINMIAGPGSAEEAANYLKTAWEGLTLFAKEQLFPALGSLGKAFTWLKDDITEWAKGTWDAFTEYIKPAIDIIKELAGWLLKVGTAAGEFVGIDTEKLKENFEKTIKDLAPSAGDVAATVLTGLPGLAIKKLAEAQGGSYGSSLVGAEEAGVRQFRRENEAAIAIRKKMSKGQRAKFDKLSAEEQDLRIKKSIQVTPKEAKFSKPGGKDLPAPKIEQNIKVEVKGDATRKTANEIANKTARAANRENRKTLTALTQRAE